MTREEAHHLLDRAKAGEQIHSRDIVRALLATGDLLPYRPPAPEYSHIVAWAGGYSLHDYWTAN